MKSYFVGLNQSYEFDRVKRYEFGVAKRYDVPMHSDDFVCDKSYDMIARPASIAARVGRRPTIPTTELSTISASDMVAS